MQQNTLSPIALHFKTAALIWDAYFAKRISAKKRDAALDNLRAKL